MSCRHRLIECPGCGLKLRGSSGPLARAGLPTCACGETFIPAGLADAARLADLSGDESILTDHPMAREEADAWVRQTLRQATKAHSVQSDRMRCGGCSRWVPAANTHCGCGFVNDIRGRRNVGGYSSAPAPSPMPF